MKETKTNVMRLLEQKKIAYTPHEYAAADGSMSGAQLARLLGEDPARTFKTLVTVGASKTHYVFIVPVEKELHLKKAAKAVGEKKIEMIRQKELLGLTGYVHGGCSPIGMKKQFQTVLDASAKNFPTILFSAGKIGCQVETAPDALASVVPLAFADITE